MSNRTCFREPWDDAIRASKLLSEAVSEHIAGNSVKASELFTKANIESIWDWWNSIAWPKSPYVKYRVVDSAPPTLSMEHRIPVRMPNLDMIRKIHERDGHCCRFCWMPVIRKEIREKISKAYPDIVTFWKTNQSRHRAFLAMWAQYDHLLPHSRWGDNSFENIILTCSACNFGRMNYTLEEVWLFDPRASHPIKCNWNWLENFK